MLGSGFLIVKSASGIHRVLQMVRVGDLLDAIR